MPATTTDAGWLYDDAVALSSHQRNPYSWQAGVERNATTQLDATKPDALTRAYRSASSR
jgi:hypothetical protein